MTRTISQRQVWTQTQSTTGSSLHLSQVHRVSRGNLSKQIGVHAQMIASKRSLCCTGLLWSRLICGFTLGLLGPASLRATSWFLLRRLIFGLLLVLLLIPCWRGYSHYRHVVIHPYKLIGCLISWIMYCSRGFNGFPKHCMRFGLDLHLGCHDSAAPPQGQAMQIVVRSFDL